MEDYGTGVMERGVALVRIDPGFAETITGDANYHVFITPRGDSESLYVINATAGGFEVRESRGGTSSLTFDYKIVAKRRGYEAQRLIDVTEPFNAAMKAADRRSKPGADAAGAPASNRRPHADFRLPQRMPAHPGEPAKHVPARHPAPGNPNLPPAQRVAANQNEPTPQPR